MTIKINEDKRKEYSHIDRPSRVFTVTSQDRWNYFIREGGIDNLYDVAKKDATIVSK